MGRGKSNKVTHDFAKEQHDRVARELDANYDTVINVLDADIRKRITAKIDSAPDEAEENSKWRNLFRIDNLVNRQITSYGTTTLADVGHSLHQAHSDLLRYYNNNQKYRLSKEEIAAMNLIAKMVDRTGTEESARIAIGSSIKEVASSGLVLVRNLTKAGTPEAKRYRYACREWAGRFMPHFKFLHEVYNGREWIARSKRPRYPYLEDLGTRLQAAGMDKLDAYKQFSKVVKDVDNALDQIVEAIVKEQPLQSLTQPLEDLTKPTETIEDSSVSLVLD